VRRLELEAEEHGEQRRRGGGQDRGVELLVKRGLRSVARCGAPPTPCAALHSGMRWLWTPGSREQRRKRNGGNPTTSLMQGKPIFWCSPSNKLTTQPTPKEAKLPNVISACHGPGRLARAWFASLVEAMHSTKRALAIPAHGERK
jgi:hypothetical protein